MDPVSLHSFKPLAATTTSAVLTETATVVSSLASCALKATINASDLASCGAGVSVIKDPLSYQEAINACALSALGMLASKDLTLDGVNDFYEFKEVPERLYPLERIMPEEASEELKAKMHAAPETIYRQQITWMDPSQKVIAMPTDEGLMLLCSYYNLKYDVTIHVVSNVDKLVEALSGIGVSEDQKVWGVIATNGNKEMPHVTAVLCARQPDDTIQILNLDSVSNPIDNYREAIAVLRSSGRKCLLMRVFAPRQADAFSCRTDALVVLKDALRELQKRGETDVHKFMKSIDPEAKSAFLLPPSWGKTVQLSAALAEANMSTEVIGKKEESIADFQKRFKTPARKKEIINVTYRLSDGSLSSETIEIEKVVRINRFLNYKGKKNLILIRALVQEHHPSLFMRFEKLHTFYA